VVVPVVNICVYCSSAPAIAQRYVDLAADVGREIARRGHGLVSGGGSVSCMGAVARAARAGGAPTIGVIPEALRDREFADLDADELIVVSTMRDRKGEMDRRADAFLTLPGGIGTLEELFEVWTARTLGMHDRPVVVLDPDGVFAPLRALIDRLHDGGFVRDHAVAALTWTTSVADAIDACETAARHEEPAADEVLEAEP
jgi:uncharacterized protein (TIGR00730 family)